MKRVWIPTLFAVLVLIYFQNTLFTNALISSHQGSDLYSYFLMAKDQLAHLQIGNFWVPRGGGYPATALNQLVVPSNLLLMGLYSITHNFLTVLRIFDPLVYFCTLCATYWYGLIVFKGKRSLSVVIAVAYAFCIYGFSQLEHLDLLLAPIFIVLCLGFTERLYSTHKNKYVVLVAVFAFLTYLTHLYAFFFLLMFMFVRCVWELCVNKERRSVILDTLKIAVITTLAAIPFLSIQLAQTPSNTVKTVIASGLQAYSIQPGAFFLRTIVSGSEASTAYLSLVILILALLPIVLHKSSRTYLFFLVTTVILLIYSAGYYAPVNLALFIHNYVPFAYFVRVPSRVLMVGCLTLAICAAFGIDALSGYVKKKWLWCGLFGTLVIAIFCDLTIGFSPKTAPLYLTDNPAYNYISQQPGDFRVIEIPSVHGQLAMTDMYTNHDTLSNTEWAYGYDTALDAAANLEDELIAGTVSPTQVAFYGVKYVILNLTSSYYANMQEALSELGGPTLSQVEAVKSRLGSEYTLVYQDNDWYVYQDLKYTELVTGNVVSYTYSPNKLTIIGSGIIQISQSYNKGWKATIGTLSENNSMTQIVLPSTTTTTTLTYTPYKKTLLLFLLYLPLLAIIILMLRKKR